MGNCFNELRLYIIRANNHLQFIHQFIPPSHHRIQVPKVSSIKFRKGFAKFMIPITLFKKLLSLQFIASVDVSDMARCSSKMNELRDIKTFLLSAYWRNLISAFALHSLQSECNT